MKKKISTPKSRGSVGSDNDSLSSKSMRFMAKGVQKVMMYNTLSKAKKKSSKRIKTMGINENQ